MAAEERWLRRRRYCRQAATWAWPRWHKGVQVESTTDHADLEVRRCTVVVVARIRGGNGFAVGAGGFGFVPITTARKLTTTITGTRAACVITVIIAWATAIHMLVVTIAVACPQRRPRDPVWVWAAQAAEVWPLGLRARHGCCLRHGRKCSIVALAGGCVGVVCRESVAHEHTRV